MEPTALHRWASLCLSRLPRLRSTLSGPPTRSLATLATSDTKTSSLQPSETEIPATKSSSPPSLSSPSSLSAPDLPTALHLLRQQPAHYAVASLQGRRYLLTPKDLLTVPRLKNLSVGEILRLDNVQELGSRDYTLRGEPSLPADLVSIQATVVEHTKGEMVRTVKKKRRKGYKKTIEHKHTYTRLRIGEIMIGT